MKTADIVRPRRIIFRGVLRLLNEPTIDVISLSPRIQSGLLVQLLKEEVRSRNAIDTNLPFWQQVALGKQRPQKYSHATVQQIKIYRKSGVRGK